MLKFNGIIQRVENVNGAYVEIPYDVEEVFGAKRVPVVAKFDGCEYRGSIVRMSDMYVIGITQDIRTQIKKFPGDVVDVELERDEEERTVDMHPDLKEAIEYNDVAYNKYLELSYTDKKKYNKWIESAKKDDVRALRVGQFIEELMNM